MFKRMLIKAISFVMVITLIGTSCAFADSSNATEKDQQNCKELINSIECVLEEDGTSIYTELCKYYDYLITERGKIKDENLRQKQDRLINNANSLISKYDNYRSSQQGIKYIDVEAQYLAAVSAILAWFSYKGYTLSAELLNHAVDNTVLNSIYYPVLGSLVESSSVFWACKNNYSVSYGTNTFPNSGTVHEKDLYYAIHAFSWYRLSSGALRIVDRYDFANDKSYWGSIQGIAVSVMYDAQCYGVLTPYYIYIIA